MEGWGLEADAVGGSADNAGGSEKEENEGQVDDISKGVFVEESCSLLTKEQDKEEAFVVSSYTDYQISAQGDNIPTSSYHTSISSSDVPAVRAELGDDAKLKEQLELEYDVGSTTKEERQSYIAGNAPSPENIARGLLDLLSPLIYELDDQVQRVIDTQKHLSMHIDALGEEMGLLMDETQIPALAAPSQKLNNAKVRLRSIHNTTTSINRRLEQLVRNIEHATKNKKS